MLKGNPRGATLVPWRGQPWRGGKPGGDRGGGNPNRGNPAWQGNLVGWGAKRPLGANRARATLRATLGGANAGRRRGNPGREPGVDAARAMGQL